MCPSTIDCVYKNYLFLAGEAQQQKNKFNDKDQKWSKII